MYLHTSLDGEIDYTAVSYVWGELNECDPIIINGGNILMVTRSLFEALRGLSSGKALTVWVDQICIDQYNLTERSLQVQMMGEIFGNATMTMIWLGTADESSESAFDLIETLAHSKLSLEEAFDINHDDSRSHLKDFLKSQGLGSGLEESRWTAVRNLAERQWFSRLWTFQEVVLSKIVVFMCDGYFCTHENLLRAFYLTDAVQNDRSSASFNTQLTLMQRTLSFLGESQHLLDLLLETSQGNYDCALPHDRVYALLALQSPQQKCIFPVDYSLPVHSLYTEVARIIISSTQNLRSLHRRRSSVLEGLPSWVADWNTMIPYPLIDPSCAEFSCSKRVMHIPEESAPQHLLTRGNIVAQITRIAVQEGDILSWLGDYRLITFITAELNEYSNLQSDGVERNRYIKWLIAMTVTCGRFLEEGSSNFGSGSVEDHSGLSAIIGSYGTSYIRSLIKCRGRRLAVLDKYPLGLVPDFAKPGDLVCVLHGSSTPMVLRKVETDFEVIGDCYVHGLMYGEAVDWSEGNKFLLR